jgi:hypothetical protein
MARLLGVLSLGCFSIYAGYEICVCQPANMLWACPLGSLAVGVGLLLRWPRVSGIGFLWLVLGVPLWILDLLTGAGCPWVSLFPHVGGLVLGLIGVRLLGLPSGVWWQAIAALYLLHFASRWVTPEESNINLAFRVWTGWEDYFPSHGTYILLIMAFAASLFAGVEFVLRKTGFAQLPGGGACLESRGDETCAEQPL